jgi:hypothetical protein
MGALRLVVSPRQQAATQSHGAACMNVFDHARPGNCRGSVMCDFHWLLFKSRSVQLPVQAAQTKQRQLELSKSFEEALAAYQVVADQNTQLESVLADTASKLEAAEAVGDWGWESLHWGVAKHQRVTDVVLVAMAVLVSAASPHALRTSTHSWAQVRHEMTGGTANFEPLHGILGPCQHRVGRLPVMRSQPSRSRQTLRRQTWSGSGTTSQLFSKRVKG